MTTTQAIESLDHAPPVPVRQGLSTSSGLATLARRRLSLAARTPRELIVPVLNPILFALVIAPALSDTFGRTHAGIDYMSFVAVSTIGFLVPFSCMSSGLGVIVDRLSGAQRDLLAAPVARSAIVVANLLIAILLSSLQVAVLMVFAWLRGAEFHVTTTGTFWFVAATVGLAVAMYGISEVLANRIKTQEEYVATIGGVAFAPWFLAGSMFPISAMPVGLTAVAKFLPLTHVLALLRYGVVDHSGAGLHDIWGMSNSTTMAFLSLGVVVLFAAVCTAWALRVFRHTAVQ
jgi:ABC-2 type transport system permease protein